MYKSKHKVCSKSIANFEFSRFLYCCVATHVVRGVKVISLLRARRFYYNGAPRSFVQEPPSQSLRPCSVHLSVPISVLLPVPFPVQLPVCLPLALTAVCKAYNPHENVCGS